MKRLAPGHALGLIPAVYFVFVTAEFAAMTHLALTSTAAGRSALAVGLLATALWSGILLASSGSHAVVQRFGHARVFVGATALATAALASLPWHAQFGGWLAACALLGLGGGFVWVAGESWLAEAAPADRRGLYVGLFETAVGLGLMAGPALVPLARWLGWPVLALSVALMLAALVCSAALLRVAAPGGRPGAGEARETAAAGPGSGGGVAADAAGRVAGDPQAWRTVAAPIVGVAMLSGLMESGVSSLMPSISMRVGFSLEAAAWLGAAIGAGSALLQPPAGLLADRFGVPRLVRAAWAVVLAANAVLLAWAADPAAVLWGVGFVLGGVGGAVYTLTIVELGHRLSGGGLVKAISALVVGYSVGTAVGPTLGGALFDAAGLRALALGLLALSALGLAVSGRAFASPPAPAVTPAWQGPPPRP